jgi:two-component system, chemotaxis family, chemotaxis protein CheY
MKILVVDDEYISRILLTEMLSAYGTCHTAADGMEAVAILQDAFAAGERFDLVCLDIMMPGIDGQEVLLLIRKMEEERHILGITKVIMTTALNDSKNIIRAFTLGGCQAYLTKPINRDKLVQNLIDLKMITEGRTLS